MPAKMLPMTFGQFQALRGAGRAFWALDKRRPGAAKLVLNNGRLGAEVARAFCLKQVEI